MTLNNEIKPPVARIESKTTKIHGLELIDDYFWLRNKESEEVIEYLKKENEYTGQMMAHTKDFQNKLFKEMKERIKETDETVPVKIGEYYYYNRTEKGKDYKIRCRKYRNLDAEEEIILDENELAEGQEYLEIGGFELSPDYKFLAYATDTSGYETFDIYIKNLETGELLEDRVKGVGGDVQWSNDGKEIYYCELDEVHRSYAVSKHIIGTSQKDDVSIFEEQDETFLLQLRKSKDQKYLFFIIHCYGAETTEYHFVDLRDPSGELKLFASREEGIEYSIVHHHGYFYFLVNKNAVNFKLMRTPVSALGIKNWEEVIPYNPEVRLDHLQAFENFLVITKREKGLMGITVREFTTGEIHGIEMLEEIYALEPWQNLEFESDIFRFTFSSLTTPKTIFDYNMRDRTKETKKKDEIKGHDPNQYITERKYATAKDGTKIPISIAYKKGIEMNGENPLLLFGYGSYGTCKDPSFDSRRLSLLERQVIFAIAHIRGGGELGKLWYRNGKMLKKMNTFTDFISCSEFLIENGYTSSSKLSINGRSAGGLLMGAVVNLCPNLFKSVVAEVPFVDVMNTMLDSSVPLTTFEYREWGNPNIKEEYEYMYQYSPYDNVETKNYPDMLVTGGLNDPRVGYWEPAKWVAKLRRFKTDENRLILQVNMGAGHSGVSGRYSSIKETAFFYAYILNSLNLPLE